MPSMLFITLVTIIGADTMCILRCVKDWDRGKGAVQTIFAEYNFILTLCPGARPSARPRQGYKNI